MDGRGDELEEVLRQQRIGKANNMLAIQNIDLDEDIDEQECHLDSELSQAARHKVSSWKI